jgi:hypothetical protein
MFPSRFERCIDDPGGHGRVCAPSDGFCHGPSALASQSGDGQVCSWCRAGIPSDCAVGTCFEDVLSSERFCTTPCTVLVTSNGGLGESGDTCPAGTYCFFGGFDPGCGVAGCTVMGVCTGDPTYRFLSCYP